MHRFLALLWLSLLWAPGAEAHPISLISATVQVCTNEVAAQLEVMCEDFVLLYGYMPDRDNYISRTNLQEGIRKHGQLLLRDFMIRDRAGQLLDGQVVGVEPPPLPERGVSVEDLMQNKVVYHLRYPAARPPDYLSFQQRIGNTGGSFLPSVMELTVSQAGAKPRPVGGLTDEGWKPGAGDGVIVEAEAQQTAILTGDGEARNYEFAWLAAGSPAPAVPTAGPRTGRAGSKMGLESYGSVYAFLYIEPAQVRVEILMPLLTLETWTSVPRKDRSFLEVAEQQAALAAVKEFFRSRNQVLVDGLEVTPLVQRLDFYGVDFTDFAVAPEPRRLGAWNARVGAILTYSTKGLPRRVDIRWALFNDRVSSARAAVFAGEEGKRVRFTPSEPTFTWTDPGGPPLPEVAPVQSADPDDRARAGIAETLLKNIYRAFDYREEKAIYDTLARSVQGELLADTYLKIHGGLLMQEQGGAVARVQRVEPLGTRITEARPGAYTAQLKWQVTGTVEHWGHIHTRVNAYEAVARIRRAAGAWRITGLDVGKQERVGYSLKVRSF